MLLLPLLPLFDLSEEVHLIFAVLLLTDLLLGKRVAELVQSIVAATGDAGRHDVAVHVSERSLYVITVLIDICPRRTHEVIAHPRRPIHLVRVFTRSLDAAVQHRGLIEVITLAVEVALPLAWDVWGQVVRHLRQVLLSVVWVGARLLALGVGSETFADRSRDFLRRVEGVFVVVHLRSSS